MALLEPVRRRRIPLSERPALSWCSWIIAIATVILAFCNADSARNWADSLTPSPISLQLREFCDAWAEAAHAMRLSIGRDAVRGAWEKRHGVDWQAVRSDLLAARDKAMAEAARLQQRGASEHGPPAAPAQSTATPQARS